MSLGPMLVLGGVGILGLLAASRSKASPAAPGGTAPGGTTTIPAIPGIAPTGKPPLAAAYREQMARILEALGVDSSGAITGKPTVAAVQAATQLASTLEAMGYTEAASYLRRYAQLASAQIPSPPASEQVQIPGLSPALQEQVNRALLLERDPKKLRAIAVELRKLPNAQHPSVQNAIAMLDAAAAQIEAQQAISDGMSQVDDIITSPGQPTGSISNPLPSSPTVPNIPVPNVPAPPPVTVQPKTAVEKAAEALALHLLNLQQRYGMPGAKGKEDAALVKRFQNLAGITADGKAGPGTMANVAAQGVARLPLVMYWPKSATKATVLSYRQKLYGIADQMAAEGKTVEAAELRNSAARERGQAGIVGAMPA